MSSYSLFDLHCDTALRLFQKSRPLADNSDCHISLSKASYLKNYAQAFAVFTPSALSDSEGWNQFWAVVDYFRKEVNKNQNAIAFPCTTGAEIAAACAAGKRAAILAIEDLRILDSDVTRLDSIYACGVRIITPVWGGDSCIGGAHDTENGLTPFGRTAVTKLVSLGIIPDISHASVKTAAEIMEIAAEAGRPAIATHSNSYAICQHSRNLRDDQFLAIQALHGIVGISLCVSHLSSTGQADVDTVIRHVDHYMELGGADTVCIGCDLDGTNLPTGFHDVSDLYRIADRLAVLGYSEEQIDKIFFTNALQFSKKFLL